MTKEEQVAVGKALAYTAEVYQRPVTATNLQMMVADLDDLPAASTLVALHSYRRDPQNRFFPNPAQIRALVEGTEDPDKLASEVAARILGAIAKYGWVNPGEARDYIGDWGWEVVQLVGGWVSVCEGVDGGNRNAHLAQWRDVAKAVHSGARAERKTSPSLTHDKMRGLLDLAMKKLPEAK